MGTAIESSAAMPVTLLIDLEAVAMNKDVFQREAAFEVTMALAQNLLASKTISKKEYREFEEQMLQKYKPLFGTLFTC